MDLVSEIVKLITEVLALLLVLIPLYKNKKAKSLFGCDRDGVFPLTHIKKA